MITADDVKWDPDPVPHREDDHPIELAALSRQDLLLYAYSAQDDIASLRFTLQQTLTALHHKNTECDAIRRALRERRR